MRRKLGNTRKIVKEGKSSLGRLDQKGKSVVSSGLATLDRLTSKAKFITKY